MRRARFLLVLTAFPLLFAQPRPAAFPGAEGFGSSTPGGRGGDVYHVTTLADSGEGSLRQGISSARGARTIVFDVAGVILLGSPLSINRPFLTLAGQTAPGDGVTIAGFTTRIVNTHDVIVRYLRFRAGDFNCPAMQDDALQVDKSSDVILDHVSASWSIDETLSVTESSNVTVQWSFIAESLNSSCHEKGEHGYGTLLRYGSGGVSMHHNLWAHHRSRNPRLGDDLLLDFVNNVIYNHGGEAGYSGEPGEGSPRMNYLNNYVIAGPSTTSSRRSRAFTGGSERTRIFQSGNLVDGNLNAERDGADTGWAMFAGAYTRSPTRFDTPTIRSTDAAEAYRQVLAGAGASLRRDAVDSRIVSDVQNGRGRLIDSQNQVGGLPQHAAAPAPVDTDRDGMADAWERARGLDPQNAADGAAPAANGYTHLELYLEDLLRPRAATPSRAALVDDTFADADSQNDDLANDSLRWFNGRAGQTERTDQPGSATFDLTAVGGSSEAFWAYFTPPGSPVTLGVGDRLTVSATFTLTGFTGGGQDIRWGILDSQGTRNTGNLTGGQNHASFIGDTGYGAQFYASGNGSPFVLGRRALLTGGNPFNNFGDFSAIAGTGANARQPLSDGVPYTLTYSIERQGYSDTRIRIAVTGGDLNGLEYSAVEGSSTSAATFDYFTFRIGGTGFARAVTFHRLLVEYLPAPPVITAQPQPSRLTLQVGGSVTILVAAEGRALEYQWAKDGEAIPGANRPSLTLDRVTAAGAGRYTVDVCNAGGVVTSDPVILTVVVMEVAPPPFIVQPPANVTVTRGGTAALSVTARGDALVYQWFRDGAILPGATASTLAVANARAADAGLYRVLVSNPSGSVMSEAGRLTVVSPMAAVSVSPYPGAQEICVDTPLTITFDSAPRLGTAGRIVVSAANGQIADVIDLSASPQSKLIGGVPFNYRPILIEGNTATVLLHAPLGYGQSYSITIGPGVFVDAEGTPYEGMTDPATWRLSTRTRRPEPQGALTVSATNSGDFCGIQSAIDLAPANGTLPFTISVYPGVYDGILYVPSNKPFLTLAGIDRENTVIRYPNNSNLNPSTQTRPLLSVDAADFQLRDLTLWNTTSRGGSQAEAFRSNGRRTLVERVTFRSFQDTILLNGSAFLRDSFIEGDVDFLWGSGAAYFLNCDIKAVTSGAVYTQVRRGEGQSGFVFVRSRLTGAAGVTGAYLSRIDPNVFPHSQVVFLDTAMGGHIRAEGWQLNNAAAAPNVRFWESASTDLEGARLDVAGRAPFSRQLTPAEAERWRDPAFVLGGWDPR